MAKMVGCQRQMLKSRIDTETEITESMMLESDIPPQYFAIRKS